MEGRCTRQTRIEEGLWKVSSGGGTSLALNGSREKWWCLKGEWGPGELFFTCRVRDTEAWW